MKDLLARALPDDLPLAPAEPLLERGRRARRISRYRSAALVSVLAVALAGVVALPAMKRPADPARPQPAVSCTGATPDSTAGKAPDDTAGKVECPPPKPPHPSPDNS